MGPRKPPLAAGSVAGKRALVQDRGFRQQPPMNFRSALRSRIKAARKRGALWVRVIDALRPALTAEGRWQLWTKAAHGRELHQTTSYTAENRYPELMGLAAKLQPNAKRILSFGCSTGEEIVTLRRYFPSAEIVGAEINPRSRRIAKRRVAPDRRVTVLPSGEVDGSFDLIFALAVLQREPHKIAEMEAEDLSFYYPFERFDRAVAELVDRLEPGGLLCVINAHYPVDAASAFAKLETVAGSPLMDPPMFGRDGSRLADPVSRTIFRKPL
jgi:SAM-dependent methyltransferase